ncbi:hypothetical protein RhiirB3_451296 [Rhizophagus irregularis]|nr:hypothetical protein RhiirB3_451296 [Rhizophagus irregularis]
MPCQILVDCLYEILEFLEEDKVTLHSCLLVNRLWCEISVRILWRDVLSFKYASFQSEASSQILRTLISCLPNESKELLQKNKIPLSTQISKYPLFNYVSFCKYLSIHEIDLMIQHNLENQQTIINSNYAKYLLLQEILKMFMKQIPSLKELKFSRVNIINITFTHFPGTVDCLKDLTVLNCSSDLHNEFFNQLSKICCKIQSLNIEFKGFVSNGLKDLIFSQNGLKYLTLIQSYDSTDWTEIIPSFTKHSKTLIELKIFGGENYVPLSFINTFKNLKVLVLNTRENSFEEFDKLHYDTFSRLEILKFQYYYPKSRILIKFLENYGKNIKELHIGNSYDNSLTLAINKFCPNLKSLRTEFIEDEILGTDNL